MLPTSSGDGRREDCLVVGGAPDLAPGAFSSLAWRLRFVRTIDCRVAAGSVGAAASSSPPGSSCINGRSDHVVAHSEAPHLEPRVGPAPIGWQVSWACPSALSRRTSRPIPAPGGRLSTSAVHLCGREGLDAASLCRPHSGQPIQGHLELHTAPAASADRYKWAAPAPAFLTSVVARSNAPLAAVGCPAARSAEGLLSCTPPLPRYRLRRCLTPRVQGRVACHHGNFGSRMF